MSTRSLKPPRRHAGLKIHSLWARVGCHGGCSEYQNHIRYQSQALSIILSSQPKFCRMIVCVLFAAVIRLRYVLFANRNSAVIISIYALTVTVSIVAVVLTTTVPMVTGPTPILTRS